MGLRLSRVARGIGALVVALAAVIATPVAAAVAAAEPMQERVAAAAPATVDVVYELQFESFQLDASGRRAPYGDPGQGGIVLTCGADERCTLVRAWGGIVVPADAVLAGQGGQPIALPGGYTASGPATGTICNESTDFTTAWRTEISLTADGATGGVYGEPIVEVCSGGGDAVTLTSVAFESVITASELVAGECWFTDEGCFAAPPEPDPAPATPSDPAEPATPSPIAVPATDGAPAASASSQIGTGSPTAPSILSTLATPAEAGVEPAQLLWAGVLTLVLVLLVALPTALLNSAVEQGTDRFSAWWSRRNAGRVSSGWNRTWPWAAFGVVIAAILSSFIDPEFGLNPGSGRVLLSILVSFALDVVIGWALAVLLVRRAVPGATHDYTFAPLTLVVVAAAVLFTRATAFEPGIVFGLVAGVAFGALSNRGDEGRAALVPLVYAYAVALVAWLGYAALGGGAASGESFWQTFAIETVAAVAIAGMAALPIALLPLRGLAGHAVFRWSRSVWVVSYALGLFSFFVVLMPMPFSWDEVALDLWVWIGVFVAYAVAAVVAWIAVTARGRRAR